MSYILNLLDKEAHKGVQYIEKPRQISFIDGKKELTDPHNHNLTMLIHTLFRKTIPSNYAIALCAPMAP